MESDFSQPSLWLFTITKNLCDEEPSRIKEWIL